MSKEFKGGMHYQGTVVSGPHEFDKENGQPVKVWKVKHDDGDLEEMTASEIKHWRLLAQVVQQCSLGPSHPVSHLEIEQRNLQWNPCLSL